MKMAAPAGADLMGTDAQPEASNAIADSARQIRNKSFFIEHSVDKKLFYWGSNPEIPISALLSQLITVMLPAVMPFDKI